MAIYSLLFRLVACLIFTVDIVSCHDMMDPFCPWGPSQNYCGGKSRFGVKLDDVSMHYDLCVGGAEHVLVDMTPKF